MKEIELKTSEISSKTITNLFYTEERQPLKDNPTIVDRESIALYISDIDSPSYDFIDILLDKKFCDAYLEDIKYCK